ncbi:MAG: tetratricopeptide repeat protein, partial [Ferruginibacter sp.]
ILTLSLILTSSANSQQMTDAETNALQLANDGKIAEAIQGFEKVLASNPKNVNAINIIVQLYEKLGNKEKQYEFASIGLLLNPADENWNYTKADLALQLGRPEEALNLAEKFTTTYPDSAFMYIIKGQALDAQGKIQLAVGAYSKTIRLHPDNAYALLLRGKDFAAISRYQNAIDDFTKLINLGQELDEIYNRRGMAYFSLQQPDKALPDFTKAISINPSNQYAYTNSGWVYYNNGDYTKAISAFTKATTIDPKYADALYGLASVYDKQKNFPLSTNYAEKAIAIDGRMPPYYAIYCRSLLSADRNNEGLVAAGKLLELDKENADGYLLKATAFSNLKKYDESLATINMGIEKYPSNYLMYGLRSFVYKQQGKMELADADTQKAASLSTKN